MKGWKKRLVSLTLTAALVLGMTPGSPMRRVYADGQDEIQVTSGETDETLEATPQDAEEITSEESISDEVATEETAEIEEAVEDEETLDAEVEEEAEEVAEEVAENMPAFSESANVDGVVVKVSAAEGVFPEGATLSVSNVSDSDKEYADAAVESERIADANVARSYTFDIKVLDSDGNELQPADGNQVKVSFTADEVADENLDTVVYHISDDGDADQLYTNVEGDVASAMSDGFSFYTVEFTYNSLEYVMDGDSSVLLSDILSYVGLTGEVTAAISSAPELFSVTEESGVWTVNALQAFTSEETLTVTINGVEYVIRVTDDYEYKIWIGSTQVKNSNKNNILGDGTVSYNSDDKILTFNNFVYNADSMGNHLQSAIYIDENGTTITGNATIYSQTNNNGIGIASAATFKEANLEIKATSGAIKYGSGGTLSFEGGTYNLVSTSNSAINGATNLNISGATILAQGNTHGINNVNTIKMESGSLIAISTDNSTQNYAAIKATNLYINGGRLEACGTKGEKAFGIDNVSLKSTMAYAKDTDTHKIITEKTNATVTVSNDGNGTGVASPSSGSTGTEVTITATPKSGFKFKEWQVVSGSAVLANTSSASTTFNIESDNVEEKATFEQLPSYIVTYKVVNGTWADSSTGNKTENVASGTSPASVPTGMIASPGYTGGTWDTNPSGATITGATTFTYTFTAVQTYNVTVTNDGNGTASADTTSGAAGTEVALSATPSAGYKFKNWELVSGSGTIANSTNANTTFTIGSSDVTVKATFEPAETYDIWVGNTRVNSVNKDNILGKSDTEGNPTAKFDPDTNTLTLSNTEINNSYMGALIYAQLDLTVKGKADLFISSIANNAIYTTANYDLVVDGAFTLKGYSNYGYYGLYGKNVTVNSDSISIEDFNQAAKAIETFTFSGDTFVSTGLGGIYAGTGIAINGNINIQASNTAIYSESGNISIIGDVTAISTVGNGIYAENGTVSITGKTDIYSFYQGIFAKNEVSVIGDTIIESETGDGIYSEGDISLDGKANIIAKDSTGSGIKSANGNITVLGDTDIEAGYYGIYVRNGSAGDKVLKLSGENNKIVSNGAAVSSVGYVIINGNINATGLNCAIDGVKGVTITGNVDAYSNNYEAIESTEGSIIIDGNVTAKTESSANGAMYAKENIEIISGKWTLDGSSASGAINAGDGYKIIIPDTHEIKEPEGGKFSSGGNNILNEDSTRAAHVVIAPKKGVITFDVNGGLLEGMPYFTVEAEVGDTITIPNAIPVRDGYTFTYWKGSEYHPGESYTVTGDHTLTAQWEVKGASGGSSGAGTSLGSPSAGTDNGTQNVTTTENTPNNLTTADGSSNNGTTNTVSTDDTKKNTSTTDESTKKDSGVTSDGGNDAKAPAATVTTNEQTTPKNQVTTQKSGPATGDNTNMVLMLMMMLLSLVGMVTMVKAKKSRAK